MLPTSNPSSPVARKRSSEAAEPVVFDEGAALNERTESEPLRPIGPERLAALRDAIRNGTYPTDAAVLGGLERMLARDENR